MSQVTDAIPMRAINTKKTTTVRIVGGRIPEVSAQVRVEMWY